MGLLNKKPKDEATAAQEPSLAEKVGDNSIEKGLPDLDNPQGKSNMGKVGLFLGLLFATGLVAAGLIVFTSGDEEEQAQSAKTEQSEMVAATESHNFNQDKADIREQENLEMAVASEAQAASETRPQEVPTLSQPPAMHEPVEMAEQPPTPITAAEPPAAAEAPPPQQTPHDRKLAGSVLIDDKQSGSTVSGSLQTGGQDGNPFLAAVSANHQSGLPSVSDESGEKRPKNPLAAQLNPTPTPPAKAKNGGNRDFLLAKGTNILCTLDTQIITTRAGFTRCVVTRDVYSANGRVLLLEKGTKIIGEQTAAMLHGQARVGILWNEVNTPKGVTVSLNSPAAGQLGAAGVGARMKYHFWQRFGGAVFISLIGDLGDAYANRKKSGGGQNISFENSSETAQDMATEALKNSINIPPTAYINHGTLINIMVARDVDFSGVYEVVNPYRF